MKIKDLIAELQKYNPDGLVDVEIVFLNGRTPPLSGDITDIEPNGFGLINATIIACPGIN